MPIPPYDSTVWDNTSAFNTFVTSLGIDTSGGGGSYGHGTYTSPSCGGVTVGYGYHLPLTWLSEPTRKFPVVYVPSLGGGSDENGWWGRNQVADPLADSPVYTSNQDGSPWFLNWGKYAHCVTILCNGGLDVPYPFDAKSTADMHGVLMLESQTNEIIDFMEDPSHPVFGGRLVPQGTSDTNGGKYRGIMGHSGGTHHATYHAAKHPERYSSVFLLAVSGGADWDPAFGPGFGPWQVHMCDSDQSFGTSIWAIHRPDGAFGATFVANQTNIFNAGIWWHMQVSHIENINETVSDAFITNLSNAGFNTDAEVKIPFLWHTDWAYTGSGGPQPLPWHVSKFKLNPSPNPSSYSTPMNTALPIAGSALLASDTDPQILGLHVASVQNPVNGTVAGIGAFFPPNKLTENSSTNFHQASSANFTVTIGSSYVISSYLKSGNRNAYLQIAASGGGAGATCNFDLTSGTGTQNSASTFGGWATPTSLKALAVGGGWYLCSAVIVPSSASVVAVMGMIQGATAPYTGDGASYVDVGLETVVLQGSTTNLIVTTFSGWTPLFSTIATSSDAAPINAVTFTPTTSFTGAASFDYTEINTDGQTATATVNVTVTAPVSAVYLLDGPVGVGVTLTDDGQIGSPTFGDLLTATLPGSSGTALISSNNPSTYLSSVTFTATVTDTGGLGGTPSGNVVFFDGATDISSGGVTLSAGVANLTTPALTIGVHTITAVYGGDGTYSGSTSSPLTQTVNGVSSGRFLVASRGRLWRRVIHLFLACVGL